MVIADEPREKERFQRVRDQPLASGPVPELASSDETPYLDSRKQNAQEGEVQVEELDLGVGTAGSLGLEDKSPTVGEN